MNDVDLKVELERAYRAIRGLYSHIVNGHGRSPDRVMMTYHSPTIGAAIRYVGEGALDGPEYFIGKPVKVLHDTLASVERTVE